MDPSLRSCFSSDNYLFIHPSIHDPPLRLSPIDSPFTHSSVCVDLYAHRSVDMSAYFSVFHSNPFSRFAIHSFIHSFDHSFIYHQSFLQFFADIDRASFQHLTKSADTATPNARHSVQHRTILLIRDTDKATSERTEPGKTPAHDISSCAIIIYK